MPSSRSEPVAPLTDAVLVAVSKLVDDAQAESYREPSHSEIQTQIDRAGLSHCDPLQQGQTLGKAKRVRAVLNWAIENDMTSGGRFVFGLIGHIRGCGGFRPESPNFVGEEAIATAAGAFASEGYQLATDGVLTPRILDGLSGSELTAALEAYVRRAKHGVLDAALLTGTSKDLLEATAGHVVATIQGEAAVSVRSFPTLLASAFVALSMSLPNDGKDATPLNRLDRSLFDAACAINTLRNKEGTGHGRPWISSVAGNDARTAIETMGVVAERMLDKLREYR